MAIVTGDRYLERLVRFVGRNAGLLLEGSLTLKLNPVGLHYVQTRLEALRELEGLLAGAPVDYLRAYVSDLGDHRALEQLRRILRLLTSLKVVAVLPPPVRDPTPLSLLPFSRLRFLELRGCDLSTSAARGLLELRHTLEKLICHNSTDALRHVFASRIADIKESPAWNRLSFVSCAFNGLVLMDESLQLLPVVESMDLSRNRFAKLDNLRKCVRLRNLDLGFNHLRSIALLSEVPCPIVKLVLRNNVLTTLHGLENLKLLEGLDLSYNIISSFSELEILASLSCLQNLWLEGNPICCARWYRAHVFSFFSHPEKLKLDDKGISTNEYWERQIIFAKRQKQPAGYGFYFPAKDDAEEGSVNTKRKKHYSRLANIEDDEHRRYYCSDSVDQESVSGDSDSLRKDENATSEGDSEIVDLMNRVEYMKKEHSDHWLREFKEWLGQTSEDMIDGSQCVGFNRDPAEEKYVQDRKSRKHLGESSKFAPDIGPVSEDGNSSSILESDISLTDPSGYGKEYFDTSGPTVSNGGDILRTAITRAGVNSEQGHLNLHLRGRENLSHLEVNGHSNYGSSVDHIDQKISPAPLTAIDELIRSPSLVNPGSPPHYEQDILDRRLYLEEEFLQLSAESISLASSDSDTSCSDAESCEFHASIPDLHSKLIQDSTEQDFSDQLNILHPNVGHEDTCSDEKIGSTSDCCSEPEYILQHQGKPFCGNNIFNVLSCGEIDQVMGQDDVGLEKQKARRKTKRRIALVVDNFAVHNTETTSQGSNGISGIGKADLNTQIRPISTENYVRDTCEQAAMVLSHNLEGMNLRTGDAYGPLLKTKPSSANPIQDDIIKDFFNSKLADSRNSETCLELVWCGCMFQLASSFKESEVALLRSCKNNLCILSTEAELDEQGNIFKVVGFHRLEDVREIVIGLGLQALRICMEGDATYLLLPRTVEKSNNILCLLQVDDSCALNSGCSLQSWEQVQVKLLEKHIGRNLKMNLFLYSMLLFSHDNCEGESWVPRSLIVIEGNMLLCLENIGKFGSSIDDCESSPPYYSLDSCCPIQNILEMVIEFKDVSWTLTLYYVTSSICNTDMVGNNRLLKNEKDQVIVWKLKWSSGDTLQKFLELIKAMYSGLTLSSLPVKCVS